jgi:hypothetical protein
MLPFTWGEGQPFSLDGRAQRVTSMDSWWSTGFPAEAGLWSATDCGPDQSGCRDLAHIAVGPAGIPGHSGYSAGDSDRRSVVVCSPTLPEAESAQIQLKRVRDRLRKQDCQREETSKRRWPDIQETTPPHRAASYLKAEPRRVSGCGTARSPAAGTDPASKEAYDRALRRSASGGGVW